MSFTLAIVGRPNVGKSTLFNRLVGKKLALVDDQPGVTRDLREGEARLGDLRFIAIDSAGLEDVTDDSLQGRMRRLTERAVEMADICLFLIDARAGVTAQDEVFADILRKKNAHVIVAANKAEGNAGEAGFLEAYSLGLGEPVRISAEHGEGLDELYHIIRPHAAELEAKAALHAPEVDVAVSDDDAEDGHEAFLEHPAHRMGDEVPEATPRRGAPHPGLAPGRHHSTLPPSRLIRMKTSGTRIGRAVITVATPMSSSCRRKA